MQGTPTVQQPSPEPQTPIEQQPPTWYGQPVYSQPTSQPTMYPPQSYTPLIYQTPQQPRQQPKKKMGTAMKWLIVAIVILGMGTLGGIILAVGSIARPIQPTTTQQATPTPQATATLSAEDNYKATARTMTITELVQSGDSSKYAIVHIQGIVVMADTASDGTPVIMIADPANNTRLAGIGLPKWVDLNKIAKGDSIEIWGQDAGMTQSGALSAAVVAAEYFTDHTSGIKW